MNDAAAVIFALRDGPDNWIRRRIGALAPMTGMPDHHEIAGVLRKHHARILDHPGREERYVEVHLHSDRGRVFTLVTLAVLYTYYSPAIGAWTGKVTLGFAFAPKRTQVTPGCAWESLAPWRPGPNRDQNLRAWCNQREVRDRIEIEADGLLSIINALEVQL